ncbi:MAG TPA: hypothetical protein DIS65_00165 [Candidatus Marinimicrobia bacterium]|nr:hypothetical protein [Candidatus Neomarinimicrobiota bacterium]
MIEIKQYFCYLRPMRISVFALVVLLLWGCSKLPEAPESADPLQNLQFEFLQYANKLYFAAEVQPDYLGNLLDSVMVLWYGAQVNSFPDKVSLNNAGIEGDIIAGDKIYSRRISNTQLTLDNPIDSSATGLVYLNVQAYYKENQVALEDSFQLGNIRPIIVQVTFPDTMTRPPDPYILVDTIKVQIFDANGVSDIQTCYMMFQKPDLSYSNNGNPILLYDDGIINQNMFLWDEFAADGIFSRLITIGSDNPIGIYNAYFYAKDFFGEDAEIVMKTVVVIE